MPRAKRASKRSRAKEPQDPIRDILDRIYLPRQEAMELVDALYLMGFGMTELGSDHGEIVKLLARSARKRMDHRGRGDRFDSDCTAVKGSSVLRVAFIHR